MKNLVLLFIVCFCMWGCRQTEGLVKSTDYDGYTLRLVNEDVFPLDSAMYVKSDIEYFYRSGGEYLVMYNGRAFDQIDIYDVQNRKRHKKIRLETTGPNSVGALPSGLFVNSLDSIFLFFNMGQRLCLINGDGQIIDKIGQIRNTDNSEVPYIDVTSRQPVFRKENELLFCTYEVENNNTWAGAVFDLNSKVTTFPFKLPEIYERGWWAGVVYDRYFHAYNKEDNLIIQSYGNDHNIYVIDANGGKKTFYAKSSYLPEKMEPYSASRGDFAKEEQYLYRHAALQGGYSTIRYDPWQKLYYRFVLRPVPASDYHTPSQTWSNVAVLILDAQFNIIGEFEIPNEYSWYQCFISSRGISFFNKKRYNDSEDVMVFGNFKLSKH